MSTTPLALPSATIDVFDSEATAHRSCSVTAS